MTISIQKNVLNKFHSVNATKIKTYIQTSSVVDAFLQCVIRALLPDLFCPVLSFAFATGEASWFFESWAVILAVCSLWMAEFY